MWRRVAAQRPRNPRAFNNLGNALGKAGRQEESSVCYRKAIEIKPDFAEAHYNLGNALDKLGRPEEAAAMFQQALALPQTAPKQSLGHLWLGRSYDLMGKREQAVAEYRKISDLSPVDPRVKSAAEQGLKHPFTRKAAASLSVDFGSGDGYGY